MACDLPVLACDSGGPIESIVNSPEDKFTGWLKTPDADVWADALTEILDLSPEDREALGRRARRRAEYHRMIQYLSGAWIILVL